RRGEGVTGVAQVVEVKASRKPDREAEDGLHPCPGVRFVVGEGLARPLAGDEDAPAAHAEGRPLVDLGLAAAGGLVRACVLRLDAVAEPVRAARRARGVPQFGPEALEV